MRHLFKVDLVHIDIKKTNLHISGTPKRYDYDRSGDLRASQLAKRSSQDIAGHRSSYE